VRERAGLCHRGESERGEKREHRSAPEKLFSFAVAVDISGFSEWVGFVVSQARRTALLVPLGPERRNFILRDASAANFRTPLTTLHSIRPDASPGRPHFESPIGSIDQRHTERPRRHSRNTASQINCNNRCRIATDLVVFISHS
jgi:hypothetical protein